MGLKEVEDESKGFGWRCWEDGVAIFQSEKEGKELA